MGLKFFIKNYKLFCENFLWQNDFAFFRTKFTKLFIPRNMLNSLQQRLHWIMHHSLFKNNKHERRLFLSYKMRMSLFLSSVLHIRTSNIIHNDFICCSWQLKRISVDKYPVDFKPQSTHTYPKFSENWSAVHAVKTHCSIHCMHTVLYGYARTVFT